MQHGAAAVSAMSKANILLFHYIPVNDARIRMLIPTLFLFFFHMQPFYCPAPLLAITGFYILCSIHSEHMQGLEKEPRKYQAVAERSFTNVNIFISFNNNLEYILI